MNQTGPRVTLQDIEASIVSERYFTAAQGAEHSQAVRLDHSNPTDKTDPCALLTLCVLVLRNGFVVMGESSCVSPENFDADLGRTNARANAVGKIWALEGFALKERMYTAATVQAEHDKLVAKAQENA